MTKNCRFFSVSPEQTREAGRLLGRLIQGRILIFLSGEMGAGKTCFTQGIGVGLKGSADFCVTSPSYTLMNLYPGRLDIYHFDLFRLSCEEDLENIGFSEYLQKEGVVIVEWAERIDTSRFEGLTALFHYRDENCRELVFSAQGEEGESLLICFCRQLAEKFPGREEQSPQDDR